MYPKITTQSRLRTGENLILLTDSLQHIPAGIFTAREMKFIRSRQEKEVEMIPFNRLDHWVLVQFIPREADADRRREKCRMAGDNIQAFLNDHNVEDATLVDVDSDKDATLALLEGMAMGTYQFYKYKTDKKGMHSLAGISLFSHKISKKVLDGLHAVLGGVDFARDLVNEPNSYLTATRFAGEVESMAVQAGIRVELLSKKKLEALQMGGLLGVNKGSEEPPVFIILEYKPARPKNKKPIVLVGKGIVYDTGGMDLKTGSNMLNMKTDMAGGAAVAGTLLAVARAKLPCHVVGLIPATDNRPGPRAIVSGDILRMHNGMTVEVINTDAEGRLILADALSYAKRYDPELAIDLSTLTGSAVRAIGKRAMAGMQSDARDGFDRLVACGSAVHERIVEFPLWEDYGDDIKSDIADVKNLGGAEAGAITAGKFLQKFTSYPYIHLDIAGPSFVDKRDSYRGLGGTGVGVRLLVEFLKGLNH